MFMIYHKQNASQFQYEDLKNKIIPKKHLGITHDEFQVHAKNLIIKVVNIYI